MITVKDLMNKHNVTRRTIYRWIDDGKLPSPYEFHGKTMLWREEDLNDLGKKSCENCKYYDKENEEHEKISLCRRFPPSPSTKQETDERWTDRLDSFAMVYKHWWCGEFKQK